MSCKLEVLKGVLSGVLCMCNSGCNVGWAVHAMMCCSRHAENAVDVALLPHRLLSQRLSIVAEHLSTSALLVTPAANAFMIDCRSSFSTLTTWLSPIRPPCLRVQSMLTKELCCGQTTGLRLRHLTCSVYFHRSRYRPRPLKAAKWCSTNAGLHPTTPASC